MSTISTGFIPQIYSADIVFTHSQSKLINFTKKYIYENVSKFDAIKTFANIVKLPRLNVLSFNKLT